MMSGGGRLAGTYDAYKYSSPDSSSLLVSTILNSHRIACAVAGRMIWCMTEKVGVAPLSNQARSESPGISQKNSASTLMLDGEFLCVPAHHDGITIE
jgi:hypothetical protein